jgi:hypothetical protein
MRGFDEIGIDEVRYLATADAAKEFGFVRDYVARLLCVPKIRFCNIGDEGRQGQVVT